ncbi:MAG: hypothetical protein KGL53_16700, partial [Elusimicrobia bacterium]|nr:hypothetical protein [Elusimicrobiota bacterium]
ALPRGALFPRGRRLWAHLGRPLTHETLRRRVGHLPDKQAYAAATALMERAVRLLGRAHARRCRERVSR